jgi:predicted transcriptional regulator YdeE
MVRAGIFFVCAMLMANTADTRIQKVHLDAIDLIGFEARTSNEKEMQSKGKIGEIVARVRKGAPLQKLSNRLDSNTYALYTDYKSDRNGEYTYFLGAKVGSVANIPRGMVHRKLDAGEYAMFTDSGNPAVNVVLKLWQKVWGLEDSGELKRAYRTDMEIHHGVDESNDPGGKIDLYVGLKD